MVNSRRYKKISNHNETSDIPCKLKYTVLSFHSTQEKYVETSKV